MILVLLIVRVYIFCILCMGVKWLTVHCVDLYTNRWHYVRGRDRRTDHRYKACTSDSCAHVHIPYAYM